MLHIGKRKFLLMLIDVVSLFLAGIAAYFLANAFEFIVLSFREVLPEIVSFSVLGVLCMFLVGVYQVMWRYGQIRDFSKCILGLGLSFVLTGTVLLLTDRGMSNFFSVIYFMFSILGMIFGRMLYTIWQYRRTMHETMSDGRRTLVVGAGNAGKRIVEEMQQGDQCGMKPIVLVDDDPDKQFRSISSVMVRGTTKDIPAIVDKMEIETIIFAIPSCSKEDKRRILGICSETNCQIKVIPYLHEIVDMENLLAETKEIQIEDLLGRDVVNLKNPRLDEEIRGSVCMVTGGGGSIGSELCRQIMKHEPKKLIIVDIYENNAYDIQQELIRTYGREVALETQIASVRDYDKMESLFQQYQPELVFHAAAHKHVPLMETSPEEAVKNNIFGTFNVASLARKYQVRSFVLVSTDKAVNPTNVMGATKRCCEMIVQYMAQDSKNTEFIAVRFGNVLGSNGSVIPLFESQLAEGKPLTVTHPDIIRYFMTIPEAVSLILQACTMARGGEIFVLDMGEPVKILTLAENLIRLHGKEPYRDVPIEFTGLRPGEKLYEELLMDEEGLRATEHSQIFIGKQISVDAEQFIRELKELKQYADENDSEKVVAMLKQVVPTYHQEFAEKQVCS
ncbi:MAG: polysaccharide biosynthesis protein [Ruminococcaceae bacterium]|nr:polysaccharide biosynthesis protein [Oscillospiraceae bacterium]